LPTPAARPPRTAHRQERFARAGRSDALNLHHGDVPAMVQGSYGMRAG